jgi:hypothetical protein
MYMVHTAFLGMNDDARHMITSTGLLNCRPVLLTVYTDITLLYTLQR